jgi:hypothetical protein
MLFTFFMPSSYLRQIPNSDERPRRGAKIFGLRPATILIMFRSNPHAISPRDETICAPTLRY